MANQPAVALLMTSCLHAGNFHSGQNLISLEFLSPNFVLTLRLCKNMNVTKYQKVIQYNIITYRRIHLNASIPTFGFGVAHNMGQTMQKQGVSSDIKQ